MKYAKIALIIAGAALLATGLYRVNTTSQAEFMAPHILQSFSAWSSKHQRAYGSPAEKMYRLGIFYKNYEMIKEHNQSGASYTMELNQFADMTPEEFKTKMLGFRFTEKPRNFVDQGDVADAPKTMDWRDHGAVNAVKNQARCGSCWAFSTIASTEAAWFKAKGVLPNLSEQQLVDCAGAYGNNGCNGGLMD